MVQYTYGDGNWQDKLTAYNGNAITYDEIGNPITYYNGINFEWDKGRSLIRANKPDGTYMSYRYNESGIRTRKTVNGTPTFYFLDGNDIIAQETGNTTYWFDYDATGNRYSMEYNGNTYYYYYNLQGDVIGLYDSDLNIVVNYTYDSWGKVLSITGSMADTLGQANPFRYRGYYYDVETGFYCICSRYYDPEICRFLNTDSAMGINSDMSTYNLFVYCGNNPITRCDVGGMIWKEIVNWAIHKGNDFLIAIGIDTAVIGGFFLMMSPDDQGIYHADYDCWQQYFGYNDLYDFAFDIGTSMSMAKFEFACNGHNYMLWAWKGDYINLGAGAEIGIYVGDGPHYDVNKSESMYMMIELTYKGENIVSYDPCEKQWWCTAFNPDYQNKNASDLTAVFGVVFNNADMYNAFYKYHKNDSRIIFLPNNQSIVIVV